jgi:hypothetical protein
MRITTAEVSPELQQILDDLEARIVACGGAPSAKPCEAEPFASHEDDVTCGCGNETRFTFPYEDEMERPCTVTACAHCDYALRWPVLAEA